MTTNNKAHANGNERAKTIIDNQQIKGSEENISFVRYDKLSLLDWITRIQKELTIRVYQDEQETNSRARELIHDMAQKQLELDSFIIKSRNVEINNDELLGKLEISFSVEIFEMLNECRHLFKYWSDKPENPALILEEYADGLHFLLSLGNHMDQTMATCDYFVNGLETPIYDENITLFEAVKRSVLFPDITEKARHYGIIGQLLGFDIQTIYEAYLAKNRTNYKRQENGY